MQRNSNLHASKDVKKYLKAKKLNNEKQQMFRISEKKKFFIPKPITLNLKKCKLFQQI
jgi:hypothetical protein